MQSIQVAILGSGTVGYGTYCVLKAGAYAFEKERGLAITVKHILVRNKLTSANCDKLPAEILTEDYQTILKDEEISIVAECMGGVEPARTYILAALNAGKTVVTANKEVVAKHGNEFYAAAKSTGAGLYIEATVCGGIPILRAMAESLQANNIQSLQGIVNGTTNFILTKMEKEGLDYATVLKQAQERGYAEADPTADVEGFDAQYKLSILSSLMVDGRVAPTEIPREGITGITKRDFQMAKALGYRIKLLAEAQYIFDSLSLSVRPMLLPLKHPLAAVDDSYNGVVLSGTNVGRLLFTGRGAGERPTASAVCSDIIYAAEQRGKHRLPPLSDAERDWTIETYGNCYCIFGLGCGMTVVNALTKNSIETFELRYTDEARFAVITESVRMEQLKEALRDIPFGEDVEDGDVDASIEELVKQMDEDDLSKVEDSEFDAFILSIYPLATSMEA